MDGTEKQYTSSRHPITKASFSYAEFGTIVSDQGSNPFCVPYSIATVLEYHLRIRGQRNPQVKTFEIYEARAIKKVQGMSFKEALNHIEQNGFSTRNGREFIRGSAILTSRIAMSDFLVGVGPFVIGVPVHNLERVEFWRGSANQGYHALAVVGYTPEGLIVQNSWGHSYGQNGFATLVWDDLAFVKEAWGIVM